MLIFDRWQVFPVFDSEHMNQLPDKNALPHGVWPELYLINAQGLASASGLEMRMQLLLVC
jgi:hypothetical protein